MNRNKFWDIGGVKQFPSFSLLRTLVTTFSIPNITTSEGSLSETTNIFLNRICWWRRRWRRFILTLDFCRLYLIDLGIWRSRNVFWTKIIAFPLPFKLGLYSQSWLPWIIWLFIEPCRTPPKWNSRSSTILFRSVEYLSDLSSRGIQIALTDFNSNGIDRWRQSSETDKLPAGPHSPKLVCNSNTLLPSNTNSSKWIDLIGSSYWFWDAETPLPR